MDSIINNFLNELSFDDVSIEVNENDTLEDIYAKLDKKYPGMHFRISADDENEYKQDTHKARSEYDDFLDMFAAEFKTCNNQLIEEAKRIAEKREQIYNDYYDKHLYLQCLKAEVAEEEKKVEAYAKELLGIDTLLNSILKRIYESNNN